MRAGSTRLMIGTLFFLGALPTAGAAKSAYQVVASKSSVEVHVGKSGALAFAGHEHVIGAPVSGKVTLDAEHLSGSSVELRFESAQTKVRPAGEPEGDAPKVEKAMHGEVLDVTRFPEIRFESRKVTGRASSAGSYELNLVGKLSLHGVTREITVPVKVTLDGRVLTAVGAVKLRHDQFKLERVSAGGGTVKVANEIGIRFRIVAERG